MVPKVLVDMIARTRGVTGMTDFSLLTPAVKRSRRNLEKAAAAKMANLRTRGHRLKDVRKKPRHLPTNFSLSQLEAVQQLRGLLELERKELERAMTTHRSPVRATVRLVEADTLNAIPVLTRLH